MTYPLKSYYASCDQHYSLLDMEYDDVDGLNPHKGASILHLDVHLIFLYGPFIFLYHIYGRRR